MKFKNIILSFLCIIFLVSSVSALSWDNKLNEKVFTFDGKSIQGNKLLERYSPIEIKNSFGFGKKLFEGYLSQHTDYCSDDCSSTIEINLLQDGILIDDIIFKTLKDDEWFEQSIRSYQFYVDGKPYEVGDELEAGKYQVTLEGEKKPSRTVDWVIKSQGKWLDEWATWGNLYCDEYCLIISAESVDESAVEIDDTLITLIDGTNNLWKINSTSADDNLSRAKILKTLFVGSDACVDNGHNYCPRILNFTNIHSITSNNIIDRNMSMYFYLGNYSDHFNTKNFVYWNFSVTSNNYISSWTQGASGNTQNAWKWFMPYGTQLSGYGASWGSEIGTDTSGDEIDGTGGGYIEMYDGSEESNKQYLRLLLGIETGSISVTKDLAGSEEAWVVIDFFTDYNIPRIFYDRDFLGVNLMEPPDDNVSINYYNNLSCAVNSPTSYIVNMSLYTNATGSWVINQTANYSADYAIWIIADSLLESEFNTNDCTIRKINNTIWKLTSTGTYEVQRAKIMQTLFYNGAILNVTNIQKLITSDNADIGMRGHNITYSDGGAKSSTANGTFSDTTNNFKSSMWSDLMASMSGAVGSGSNMNAEFAIGNQVNIASLAGCGGGTCFDYEYELGTDTSADELDNPVNCEFNYGSGLSGGGGRAGVVILSVGSISWTTGGGPTFSEIDYTDDHSIPEFSGNETYESFNINIENLTEWACQACDSDGDCSMSLENRTIRTELTVPEVSINYPAETTNYGVLGENETLNWTISDLNIDACWYSYNNTNTTITCNDNSTEFILVEDWYNVTLWANDTFGNTNSSFLEFSYKVLQNSQIYNSYTYETASETFSINLTANSSLTDVDLIHNTISHDTTLSGGLYNTTFDIPNSVGNKSFYWEFTYAGSTINSDSYNQTVNNNLFGICNATLTVPYINFTFVDEETLLNINATIDTSSWTYYLGSGTITKSLIYSNTTAHDNYAFCLSASNDTLHNTRSLQYSSPGYPQRKYDASSDLTNATTNKTLYLLSSADGIYSTIQVIDEQGDKLIGVEVTAEREFAGIWTVVGEETTDSAGSVTFWVNPDYDHKFTFVSDDCTDTTATVRPTQTQYTQQLQCIAGDGVYVTSIEGIKYSRTPVEGLILTGEHNFTFEVVSSKDNIINISMEIVNASDGTILASNWSGCSPGGCSIYTLYTVLSGDDLKGRYYLDLGNGTFMIEGDAHWVNVLGPTAFDGRSGFRTFWQDMIYVFQEWGDDSNTADFNRLVAVFFILCVSLSVLNYHFNMDTLNPGAFMFILFIIVLMGSMVGGTDSQGFFYFNNLASEDKLGEQGANFINNYILTFFCMIISLSYWINVNRQAQR